MFQSEAFEYFTAFQVYCCPWVNFIKYFAGLKFRAIPYLQITTIKCNRQLHLTILLVVFCFSVNYCYVRLTLQPADRCRSIFFFFGNAKCVLYIFRAYAWQRHSDNQGWSSWTNCWAPGNVQRGSQHQFQLLTVTQNSVHLQRWEGWSDCIRGNPCYYQHFAFDSYLCATNPCCGLCNVLCLFSCLCLLWLLFFEAQSLIQM